MTQKNPIKSCKKHKIKASGTVYNLVYLWDRSTHFGSVFGGSPLRVGQYILIVGFPAPTFAFFKYDTDGRAMQRRPDASMRKHWPSSKAFGAKATRM